jgi:hypothetical protein
MTQKQKHQSDESQPAPPPPEKRISSEEVERRLAALEKASADMNNRIFDRHSKFVTIIFTLIAILLTVYGVASKLDVRDSMVQ